jgi:hypothetical protein
MGTRESLLTLIDLLPEENLTPLLQIVQLIHSERSSERAVGVDLKTMLLMTDEARTQLLVTQSNIAALYFQSGTEDMEWVEDYVEDGEWENG